jgi:hypothetical protein
MSTQIKKNAFLTPRIDDAPIDCAHRILYVDEVSQEVSLYRATVGRNGMPFFVDLSDVNAWIERGEVCVEMSLSPKDFVLPAWVQKTEEEMSPKEKAFRDARWKLLEPLVTGINTRPILDRELRGKLLQERGIETGKKRVYFYDLLHPWWLYGQVPNALVPAFDNCSGRAGIRSAPDDDVVDVSKKQKETPKASSDNCPKRGRPRENVATGHDPDDVGVNVCRIDRINIARAVRDVYIRKGKTFVEAYDWMRRLFILKS